MWLGFSTIKLKTQTLLKALCFMNCTSLNSFSHDVESIENEIIAVQLIFSDELILQHFNNEEDSKNNDDVNDDDDMLEEVIKKPSTSHIKVASNTMMK